MHAHQLTRRLDRSLWNKMLLDVKKLKASQTDHLLDRSARVIHSRRRLVGDNEVRRRYWQVAGTLRKAPGQRRLLQGRLCWEKKNFGVSSLVDRGSAGATYLEMLALRQHSIAQPCAGALWQKSHAVLGSDADGGARGGV